MSAINGMFKKTKIESPWRCNSGERREHELRIAPVEIYALQLMNNGQHVLGDDTSNVGVATADPVEQRDLLLHLYYRLIFCLYGPAYACSTSIAKFRAWRLRSCRLWQLQQV